MPKMPYYKYIGHTVDWLCSFASQKITSPASAMTYDFSSYVTDTEHFDIFTANKIEACEDIWSGRVRVMNDQTEGWAVLTPNDWPEPIHPDDAGIIGGGWVDTTKVGSRDLRVCDIDGVATTVYVYDAINGPAGQINPPGGFLVKNVDRGEVVRVTGTSHSAPYDIFSGITRNWGTPFSYGVDWKGHDRGSITMGPPVWIPPDTVHDQLQGQVFTKALMGFYSTGIAQASMLPRPITYAPKGSRNGIFMPIILRYLSTLIVKKTTTTTTEKKTAAPKIATGCDGSLLVQ